MKINNIVQAAQTQQVQKKGRKADAAAPAQQNGDKVEISSAARQLSKSNNVSASAAKAIQDAPEVRSDKIAEVREKINQGFYNRDNVSAALADKLLKEFGI